MQSVILGSQGAQEAAILNPMSTIQDAQRTARPTVAALCATAIFHLPSSICHLPSET
jgi:hypothetical protein